VAIWWHLSPKSSKAPQADPERFGKFAKSKNTQKWENMKNYTDQTMEKCVFFPTFSIFHALGSILTTGGVLGSWTLVKLLSSPLEEGRTNIKGQMGLGPQPIHEK